MTCSNQSVKAKFSPSRPRCYNVSIGLACPISQAAGVTSSKSNDPLDGVTLEKVLIELVAHYGWEEMGRRAAIRCFLFDPERQIRSLLLPQNSLGEVEGGGDVCELDSGPTQRVRLSKLAPLK